MRKSYCIKKFACYFIKFGQIINAAIGITVQNMQQGNLQFNVLVILTDGIINDMGQTKDAIVEASKYPMAIIIIGVGNADFSKMEELDGDDGVLRNSRGEPALRDIVQFVPMNQFQAMGQEARLAKETLKEVPGQVCSYMEMSGRK